MLTTLETVPNHRYRLVLKALSPIALLRTRVSTQFGKSLDYIPGATVRGAIAEIFLNKRGSNDPLFQRIFVNEAVRFHDFLPAVDSEPATLLPLSASACKRHKLGHAASLRDRLIDSMLQSYLLDSDAGYECPECQKELDRVSGYVYRNGDHWEQRKLQRQLRMHVGISRARGSALHGLLFSYDMLTQKQFIAVDTNASNGDESENALIFAGEIEVFGEDSEQLWAEFLNAIGNDHLSVGKARTRGLGELKIEKTVPLDHSDDFDDRWAAFNTAMQERGASGEYCYFSVTLKSHLILRDRLGRPVLENFGTERCPVFGKMNGVERMVAFTNATIVSGWNAAQGLPRPDVLALERGSALAFRARKENEESFKEILQRLESTGLGERRAEGFGVIRICDPLHFELST